MSKQEVVYLNGNYSPKHETTLSILDRGFYSVMEFMS